MKLISYKLSHISISLPISYLIDYILWVPHDGYICNGYICKWLYLQFSHLANTKIMPGVALFTVYLMIFVLFDCAIARWQHLVCARRFGITHAHRRLSTIGERKLVPEEYQDCLLNSRTQTLTFIHTALFTNVSTRRVHRALCSCESFISILKYINSTFIHQNTQ